MHFSQYFLMELQNISIPIEGHTKNIVNSKVPVTC